MLQYNAVVVVIRTEWIEAINTVSKELRKTDVEPARPAQKTEGATVPKLGIKVHFTSVLPTCLF
jgi:hypothetical protein